MAEQEIQQTEGSLPDSGELAEAAPEAEALRQALEEEKKKSAEYYDQWLRSVAELRNYKKRVEQEREQMAQEAAAGLVLRLLPILDDFERALAVLPDEKLLRFSWIEGVALIYRRLQATLEQDGLRAIESVGKPFDPYVHEAVFFEEAPAEQDSLVLAELQKGYRLRERVLRPALVKVGRARPQPSEARPAGGPAEETSGEKRVPSDLESGEGTLSEMEKTQPGGA